MAPEIKPQSKNCTSRLYGVIVYTADVETMGGAVLGLKATRARNVRK